MGFEPVDFAGGRTRHCADHLTVDDKLELVILSGDGDNLAGVDQADLDALQGRASGTPAPSLSPDEERNSAKWPRAIA
jgi:hypothetical protein